MPELNDQSTVTTQTSPTTVGTADAGTKTIVKKGIEDYAKELDALDVDVADPSTDGDSATKKTAKADDKTKSDDPSADGDSNDDGIELPEEYQLEDDGEGLTAEDLEEHPELAARVKGFEKKITAKFAKLDAEHKAKMKELEQREKDVTEHEAVLLEALNDGLELPAEKQAALAKLVEKVPYVKELIDRANNLQAEYINLYAARVRDEAYRHLAELGYTAKEAEALFAADGGKQATKIASLLTNGLSIEEALRAIGVGSKRKKLTTPATTTSGSKKPLSYEEKLAHYSKQLD